MDTSKRHGAALLVLVALSTMALAARAESATENCRDGEIHDKLIPVVRLIGMTCSMANFYGAYLQMFTPPALPYNYTRMCFIIMPIALPCTSAVIMTAYTAGWSAKSNQWFPETAIKNWAITTDLTHNTSNVAFHSVSFSLVDYDQPRIFFGLYLPSCTGSSTTIYMGATFTSDAPGNDGVTWWRTANGQYNMCLSGNCADAQAMSLSAFTLRVEGHNHTVSPGEVIPGWTCDPMLFADGVCHCGCGIVDSDCRKAGAPSNSSQCKGFLIASCQADKCVESWKCPPAAFNDSVKCDCNCGGRDPDCDVVTPKNSCGEGLECYLDRWCVSTQWTCPWHWYGNGSACDCNCGARDPDCFVLSLPTLGCANSTYSCASNSTCVMPGCGNTAVEPSTEQCDSSRHCNSSCMCLPLYNSTAQGTCDGCGNGIFDEEEQCDRGIRCVNTTCKCEAHYKTNHTVGCVSICGDGFKTPEEQCDRIAFCSNSTCTCEPGHELLDGVCRGCGNGVVQEDEECDGGAHCSPNNCTCPLGWLKAVPAGIDCVAACGNQRVDLGDEQCDGGKGCLPNCACSFGYFMSTPQSLDCVTNCSDLYVTADEECDGDPHCNQTTCKCVPPFVGVGSGQCSMCGNGALDTGEQCEGAHCHQNCTCMLHYKPSGTKDCVTDCGDGFVTPEEQCETGRFCNTTSCTCLADHSLLNGACRGCGNGIKEPGEVCDTVAHCNGTCGCEPGFKISTVAGSNGCDAVCGDKLVVDTEECDSTTFCNPDTCKCAPNHALIPGTNYCSGCGNKILDGQEECDGDRGCASSCHCLQGFHASLEVPYCRPKCGDTLVVTGEECDSTAWCDNVTCTCQAGHGLNNQSRRCSGCGNEILDPDEECDSVAHCHNAICKCLFGVNATNDCLPPAWLSSSSEFPSFVSSDDRSPQRISSVPLLATPISLLFLASLLTVHP